MIKARVNKKRESICAECGAGRDDSLDLFDIKLAGKVITVCDKCADDLLYKSLGCVCYVNHRTKSPKDMRIIRQRNAWKDRILNATKEKKK